MKTILFRLHDDIDLIQSLIECQIITELILENGFNEALRKTSEQ